MYTENACLLVTTTMIQTMQSSSSCQIVSHPTFRGLTRKGRVFVRVRACVHHTSQMTCQGVVVQLVDWHPKLETAVPLLHIHLHTPSHTVCLSEVTGP